MKKHPKNAVKQKATKGTKKTGISSLPSRPFVQDSSARPAGDGLAAAAASPVTEAMLGEAYRGALKRIPDTESVTVFVARLGHLEVQLRITRDADEFVGSDDPRPLRRLTPAKGALNAPGCTRVTRQDDGE